MPLIKEITLPSGATGEYTKVVSTTAVPFYNLAKLVVAELYLNQAAQASGEEPVAKNILNYFQVTEEQAQQEGEELGEQLLKTLPQFANAEEV